MVYLYVIKSDVNGELYVGICLNIDQRLKEHERGKNRFTKGLRPWKLVLSENTRIGKAHE
jgi:putative endonuclease